VGTVPQSQIADKRQTTWGQFAEEGVEEEAGANNAGLQCEGG
jgi:hypothetical protein